MNRFRSHPFGFTLLEVLLTLALIGIIIGPLSVGLLSLVSSARARIELEALVNAARGKMEEVLALGFDHVPLGSPSPTISDNVTINGQDIDRDVYVVTADGDLPPDATADADFKHVRVVVNGFELEVYLAPPL